MKRGSTIKTCLHSHIWLEVLSLCTGLCGSRLEIEITHTCVRSLNSIAEQLAETMTFEKASGWEMKRMLSVSLTVMAFLLVLKM